MNIGIILFILKLYKYLVILWIEDNNYNSAKYVFAENCHQWYVKHSEESEEGVDVLTQLAEIFFVRKRSKEQRSEVRRWLAAGSDCPGVDCTCVYQNKFFCKNKWVWIMMLGFYGNAVTRTDEDVSRLVSLHPEED